MLRINEFSRLGQVTVKVLRYYDEIGLLKPANVDHSTGECYYSARQLSRVNRILVLEDLGLSPAQIAHVLDSDLPLAQIRGMLRLKQTELAQRIREEQARLEWVEWRIRQIEHEGTKPVHEVVIKTVKPQTVAAVRDVIPRRSDVQQLLYEVVTYVAQYGSKSAGFPLIVGHNTECYERGVDAEAAVPVDTPLPTSERVVVRQLLGIETAACVVHHGSYDTVAQAYWALWTWIEANNYHSRPTAGGPNTFRSGGGRHRVAR